jgi:hypothetical protein
MHYISWSCLVDLMKTKTILTSELIGTPLDYAVTLAEGDVIFKDDEFRGCRQLPNGTLQVDPLPYSTDRNQGGLIIDREKISTIWTGEMWAAAIRTPSGLVISSPGWVAHTALIAGMRCYVSLKLGDKVAIPVELL